MIKVIKKEIPLYELMGVFTEAPKSKKKKKRIVNASASSNLKDFTTGMEPDEIIDIDSIELDDIDPEDMDDLTTGSDMEELEDDTIQSDDDGEEDFDDLDFTDGMENDDPEPVDDVEVNDSDDSPELQDNTPDEGENTEQPVDTGTKPVEGQENNPDTEVSVDTGEEQPSDQSGDTELDLGGDGTDDFTADAMDPNADPSQAADTSTQSTDPNIQESATKDDMRKFVLYKKYMSLFNSIENYVKKIDNIRIENMEAEYIKKDVCNKFRDIQDVLRDYMIIKYSSDSYVQCTLMYEKMRTAVLLLFEKVKVLMNNKKQ